MQGCSDCSPRARQVNRANCLIKNLSEMDTLPHVRKLSEMPRPSQWDGRRREVDDEREKVAGQGGIRTLPESPQERKGADTGRFDCIEWLQPLVRGGAIARAWQGHPGRAPAKAGGRLRPLDEAPSAADLRWRSA